MNIEAPKTKQTVEEDKSVAVPKKETIKSHIIIDKKLTESFGHLQ